MYSKSKGAAFPREVDMGVDIILQCFRDGESTTFPPAQIERSFGPYGTFHEPKVWVLRYPDGGLCELSMYITEQGLEGFFVQRPPANPEFWKSLFDLMKQTPSCLFFTSGGLYFANPSVREHIPADVIEQSGEPIFVSTPEQFLNR